MMGFSILLREMLLINFLSALEGDRPRPAEYVEKWIGDRGVEGAPGSRRGEVVFSVYPVRPPSEQVGPPGPPEWGPSTPMKYPITHDMLGREGKIYEGEEQIGTFLEALMPGFRCNVRELQGREPTRGQLRVEAAVGVSANLLKEAGVDHAEARVSAIFSYASPLILYFGLYFWQETFEKLATKLPPGQEDVVPDGAPPG